MRKPYTLGRTQPELEKALDAIKSWSMGVTQPSEIVHACNCIGPQNGERVCPCRLRSESEQGRSMIRDGVVIDGKRYRLVSANE